MTGERGSLCTFRSSHSDEQIMNLDLRPASPTASRVSDAPAIEIRGLRKRFGATTALDDTSFTVDRGSVTGFLGPNGAGKTTAMRILVGLDNADAGEALVHGRSFRTLDHPASVVGTLLDSSGFHPVRTGRQHLWALGDLIGVDGARVEQVLDDVQLTGAADRPVGGYSLGMRRRLGLASALLGNPEVLVLDEPSNGLDPAGSRWLRSVLRRHADAGGTVFVSSHLLSEVAQVADDVVVINAGRVVAETSVDDIAAGEVVVVQTRLAAELTDALTATGVEVEPDGDRLIVTGRTAEEVGLLAASERIPLIELSSRQQTLEQLFFSLTEDR